MNRKLLSIVLLLMLVIILVGCTSGGSRSVADVNYQRGVKEVSFDFVKGSPPSKVFQDSPLKLIIDVENEAAYDVFDVDMRLIGLDETHFFIADSKQEVDRLQGKSVTNPIGDRQLVSFDVRTGTLQENEKELKDNFILTASYKSTSDYFDTVCIHPGIYTIGKKESCRVDDTKSYSGQGSPLAVTKLEQITFPGDGAEVEFRFTIKNRGKGKIGKVALGIARIGSKDMNCKFQNSADNDKAFDFEGEKEATLVCRALIDSKSPYVTTVALDFSYDYEISKKHQLNMYK